MINLADCGRCFYRAGEHPSTDIEDAISRVVSVMEGETQQCPYRDGVCKGSLSFAENLKCLNQNRAISAKIRAGDIDFDEIADAKDIYSNMIEFIAAHSHLAESLCLSYLELHHPEHLDNED